MERKLLLVRHAKSDWGNPQTPDYDRPLNSRGLHDAPMMGGRLKTMGLVPDLIIAQHGQPRCCNSTAYRRCIGL